MNDLFSKIIKGEIPSSKVYEDDIVYAFLDIRPCNKGHTLVVPKIYFRNMLDMDQHTFGVFAERTHMIARAVKDALNADGINIVMNNEKAAGQEIFHAHFHVIPRFTDDGIFTEPTHTSYEEGEIEMVAEKICAHLA